MNIPLALDLFSFFVCFGSPPPPPPPLFFLFFFFFFFFSFVVVRSVELNFLVDIVSSGVFLSPIIIFCEERRSREGVSSAHLSLV